MKKLWNEYHTPQTVEEASALLASYAGAARVIAGGTDLILEMEQGHKPPVAALVDVTAIQELTTIRQEGELVTVGAGVTHTQLVGSTLLAARATCLVESCGVVGGPQVRNVATLGGNIAHALPAADGTTSLMALDAEAEIAQHGTRRWLPLVELFSGPGQSLLDSTRDLLLNVRFRLAGPREASAFKRIMRPQGVALPVLGCAVWLRLAPDSLAVEDARVCISPVAPVPARATEVEAALRGQPFCEALVEAAVEAGRASLHPRTSKYRATAEYRTEMIDVLLRRTLPLAFERARTGVAIPEGVGM
ncbi:MAG: FAD binding domain-containing protein [Anaerolineae bacterium]|nr:FAD binding domain-containing protein [Anaerolineae bacterium]